MRLPLSLEHEKPVRVTNPQKETVPLCIFVALPLRMSLVAVSTPFNIDLEFEIAPFHKRLFAYFIDLAILLLYSRGMKFFLYDVVNMDRDWMGESVSGIDIVVVSLPMLLYHPIMEIIFQGQSLGKKAMGIRVISLEGGEPNIGQYLMRWLFRVWEWTLVFGYVYSNSNWLMFQVLFTCILGVIVVIIIAISKKSQRLGDMAASTTVVDVKNKLSINDTVFMDIQNVEYQVRFPEVMRLSDRDINAVKSVITQTRKSGKYDTAYRVAYKVKDVLKITSDLDVLEFLERLLADYNYLATRE